MAKKSFSAAERSAIWVTHGEECYLCGAPVLWVDLEIDHVIPESLPNDPTAWANALNQFGLPATFDVNSYRNLMPAHHQCNRTKSAKVFRPTPLIQLVLDEAAKQAPKVQEIVETKLSDRKVSRSLNVFEQFLEDAESSTEVHEGHVERVAALFKKYAHRFIEFAPIVEILQAQRVPKVARTPIGIAPGLELISEENGIRLVRGPAGIGARPVGTHLHPSWDCPRCGPLAHWEGARCVSCGMMSDGD